MFGKAMHVTTAVFFCLVGWVWSASAIGAPPESPDGTTPEPTPAVAPATQAAPTPQANVAEPAKAPATPQQAETPAPEGNAAELLAGPKVNVGSFGQIELHVKDLDMTKVLQLLAMQSQRNIIASKNISGTVTADLYNVGFFDALKAILQPNGYGFKEQGNFIYVYTAEELKKLQDVDRKTIAKVVRLNYMSASDAATFVTKMLSSAGSIALNGPAADNMQPTLADNGINKFANAETLVIVDFPENVEQIVKVLEQLDVRPKQVLIEATVLEILINEEDGWGLNISAIADMSAASFTNPLSAITDLSGGTIKSTAAGVISSTPTPTFQNNPSFQVGVVTNHASAFLSALEQVTTTHVLAHPKTLVLNRQRSDLLVGKRLAYLSTTTTSTTSTQTVDYLDTGTQLTVRPFISDDGLIRLELKPSITDGVLRNIGTTTVPDASTESLITNVMVRNGQTVVLGGLFNESTTTQRNQMPGVGDIPLIGAAFKGHDDNIIRSETIFLVTPTIIKDETLGAVGDRLKDDVELSRIGAREGLLPWSKSKVAASYMRKALQCRDQGDKDKALWNVNLVLTLDPTYAEARRLREELGASRGNTTTRTLLDDAVKHVVDQQLKPAAEPAPAPSGK